MKSIRRITIPLAILVSFSAYGSPQILGIGGTPFGFVAHYNNIQAGLGDKMGNCFGCVMCHSSLNPGLLDQRDYAKKFWSIWSASDVGADPNSPDSFADAAWTQMDTIDADSDGDGTHDLEEIKALSNPGDAVNNRCPGSVDYGTGDGGSSSDNPNLLNPGCGIVTSQIEKNINGPKPPTPGLQFVFWFLPLVIFGILRQKNHAKTVYTSSLLNRLTRF